MKPQLIFLGAPGSGKGTQSKRLVKELSYGHLSTGDLLRAEIAKGTDLGKRITKIMDEGQLVDDKTVLELLSANCNLKEASYIFDGYPRNLEQAQALDSEVLGDVESKVVFFEVKLEDLISRIVNRRTCPKCGEIYNLKSLPPKVEDTCDVCGHIGLSHRKDDNEETVTKRMTVFNESTAPVLEYYKQNNRLHVVDASLASDVLFEQLKNIID